MKSLTDFLAWKATVGPGTLVETQAMCERLGQPERRYRSIHVAGTNGKGSVCVKLAKCLEGVAPRVGLYTSPHIHSLLERIRVNSQSITEVDFLRIVNSLLDQQPDLGWFTVLTLAGFVYFAEQHVDWAVVEVGVGGRLDNTNTLLPNICVITSIGFDHVNILGNSLESITMEKAGIIKPGVPVVLGPGVRDHLIQPRCTELGSPLIKVPSQWLQYESFLSENTRIAETTLKHLIELGALEPTPALWQGLQNNLAGRKENCSFRGFDIVLDVGHNPLGIHRLISDVLTEFPGKRVQVLVGISEGKMAEEMMAIVAEQADKVHVTSAPNTPMIPYQRLAEFRAKYDKEDLQGCEGELSVIFEDVVQGLTSQDVLVVCGTFPLVDAVKQLMAINLN